MSRTLELLARLGPKGQNLDMPTDPSFGGLTWEIIAGAVASVSLPGRLVIEIKYQGLNNDITQLIEYVLQHVNHEFKVRNDKEVLKRVVTIATNEHIMNLPCKKCDGTTWIMKGAAVVNCTKCGGSGKSLQHATDRKESYRRRAHLCGLDKMVFNRDWRDIYHSAQSFLEEAENYASFQLKRAMRDN